MVQGSVLMAPHQQHKWIFIHIAFCGCGSSLIETLEMAVLGL